MTSASDLGLVVEAASTTPWSSLTFTGERHGFVVRVPSATPATAIDGDDLALANTIVAVERADWTADGDARRLALDLLVIAYPRPASASRP